MVSLQTGDSWPFHRLSRAISSTFFMVPFLPFSILSISFLYFFSTNFLSPLIAAYINYTNRSRKDIRFPLDYSARRNKTMLWIDPLLQCSLLGHIRRLSTRRLSQSVEYSIWQRHQSKSHQTRTGKRRRKGRMRNTRFAGSGSGGFRVFGNNLSTRISTYIRFLIDGNHRIIKQHRPRVWFCSWGIMY